MNLNIPAAVTISLVFFYITITLQTKLDVDKDTEFAKQGLQQCQQPNGRVIWQKECK